MVARKLDRGGKLQATVPRQDKNAAAEIPRMETDTENF
jgi:hypothetical protein